MKSRSMNVAARQKLADHFATFWVVRAKVMGWLAASVCVFGLGPHSEVRKPSCLHHLEDLFRRNTQESNELIESMHPRHLCHLSVHQERRM